MVSIIEKLNKLIGELVGRFAADGSKKQFGLRFGNLSAVLLRTNTISFNPKGRFLERTARTEWSRRDKEFFIFPQLESNPHIVISGMSGFGKSTLFKSLLSQIVDAEVSCLIFDAHNEHSDIVRGLDGQVHNALYSGINILELDGASVSERISELTRLFKEIYSLGYIQSTKLSECLWYTYRKAGARSRIDRELSRVPTIRDLLDELSIFIRNSKSQSESNTLLHLRDRISLLNSAAFSGSSVKMEGIVNGLNSFSLAGMRSKESQLVYISELLGRLYTMMHDSSSHNKLKLYIMIDEAQFLIDNSNNNSIIAKLIEEGRKYGIGVIIVTHAASTLNRKIIANSSIFMSFYAREPSEVSYIAKVLSGGNGIVGEIVKERIRILKQNEAILVGSQQRMPVIIATPRFNDLAAEKREELREHEVVELLRMIAKRPIRRSELCKKEARVSSQTLDKLISSGLIDCFAPNIPDKQEWVMYHNPSLSIEHEVWVKIISEMLEQNGIDNKIIDNSSGPDLVAYSKGKRIAMEYETGSKSAESTQKMIDSRLKYYDNIIIVTKAELKGPYTETFSNPKIEVISSDSIDSVIGRIKRG